MVLHCLRKQSADTLHLGSHSSQPHCLPWTAGSREIVQWALSTSAEAPETMVQIIPCFQGLGGEDGNHTEGGRKPCWLGLVGPDDERRKVNLTQTTVSETAIQDRKEESVTGSQPCLCWMHVTWSQRQCVYTDETFPCPPARPVFHSCWRRRRCLPHINWNDISSCCERDEWMNVGSRAHFKLILMPGLLFIAFLKFRATVEQGQFMVPEPKSSSHFFFFFSDEYLIWFWQRLCVFLGLYIIYEVAWIHSNKTSSIIRWDSQKKELHAKSD